MPTFIFLLAGLTLCALGWQLVLGAGPCTLHEGLGGLALCVVGLVSIVAALIRWHSARRSGH